MELYELHVLHGCFGAIGHGDAVARGNVRVGCRGIHRAAAAGGEHRDTREHCVNLVRVGVEHVRAETFDVGRAAGHLYAEVVLRDDFHGKVIFEQRNIRVAAHCFNQAALYLEAGVIGMVEDTELGVSAFAMQVKLPVFFLIEIHAPLHEPAYAFRRAFYHLLHGAAVADIVARNKRVFDVLLEIVYFEVGHGGDAALCLCGVGFFD